MPSKTRKRKLELVDKVAQQIVDSKASPLEAEDLAHVKMELDRMDISTLELLYGAYGKA